MPLSKIQGIQGQVTPNLGRRNLIINGAMQIAQRGTVTGMSSGATFGGPDRFASGITSHGAYTASQSTTVPSGKGFAKSYKLDCTTADTSIAANAEVTIQHKFEGNTLQSIRKGTSEAKSITATFYCRSNLTGTFTLEFFDNDNSRQCSKNFTISSANTWEFKSITFPADTTGTLDDDHLQSAVLVWWLAAGSNFTSGTQNTSAFASNTNANRVSSSIVNMSSSTDNEFLLTGVQLELGDSATDFEHRSFAEDLALCQRYYFSLNYPDSGSRNVWLYAIDQSNSAAGYRRSTFMFPTAMRVTPTMSADFTGSGGTGGVDSAAPWTGRNSVSFFMNGISSGNDYAYADDVIAQAEL